MKGFTSGETPIRLKEAIEPRLISSISRTGRVILQDDFESYTSVLTEKWTQTSGTIALSTTGPFRGKSCAKLTTGAVAGNYAEAALFLGTCQKGRYGFELWWKSIAGVANLRSMKIVLCLYDGVTGHTSQVQWLGTTGAVLTQKWQYYTTGGVWSDVPNGAQVIYVESAYPTWHHIKVIVDFNTDKYVKLTMNEKEFDLSNLPLSTAANTSGPYVIIKITFTTETATAIDLYVDDVVWTDSEP